MSKSEQVIESLGWVDGETACGYLMRGYCKKTLQKLRQHPAFPLEGHYQTGKANSKILYKVDALLTFHKKLIKREVTL